MIRFDARAAAGLLGLVLLCGPLPARAGVMDFLFGSKKAAAEAGAVDPAQRRWRIGEFTAIQLAPKETAAPANEHPQKLHPEGLRQQLTLVRTPVKGAVQPLFSKDELDELVEPLAQALSVAGPGDDVLLLSTARRGEGVLGTPRGITARLFVQGGHLNMLVHDARLDFVNDYIGSRIAPQFDFGSRGRAGTARIESSAAANRRADWLALPLAPAAKPQAAALGAPAAAPIAVVQPAPAAVAPAPAAVTVSPANRPRDTAFYEEQAQRLKGIKLLRDQGAISEEEYQQKRREILSSL